eukprot:CAMPEP_0168331560 /NCGR_PEP_ID=MMETSP0213-20121227/8407_1 /TAXON_ID=151035 /ORGANISM="Euplotes harpa, Strain FSP1.4" /LENGTH=142 /DNA_ID=CAMNT_0008335361 /DNA_START=130 /DNA_END=558 /DNA_ORIENTATION=+
MRKGPLIITKNILEFLWASRILATDLYSLFLQLLVIQLRQGVIDAFVEILPVHGLLVELLVSVVLQRRNVEEVLMYVVVQVAQQILCHAVAAVFLEDAVLDREAVLEVRLDDRLVNVSEHLDFTLDDRVWILRIDQPQQLRR